jgi:hypothetical protein
VRLAALALTLSALLVAGCGGEDGDGDDSGRLGPPPEAADLASDARGACAAATPEQAARDLGLDPDADLPTIAAEYASIYQPQFRSAIIEGCLDGFANPYP